MKYLHGTGLFAAIVGVLYMTQDVWPDAEYQTIAKQFESTQKARADTKKQAKDLKAKSKV